MNEYAITAVVLEKEPSGEADSTIKLFSQEFGKLTVKTKSTRKMLSKVNGHTQPGALFAGRVVEKNTALLVDALQLGVVPGTTSSFSQLAQLLPEAVPERALWSLLSDAQTKFPSWNAVLGVLGWGHELVSCLYFFFK